MNSKMNANLPIAVVTILLTIFGLFHSTCAKIKKPRNENLTSTLLTNTKSTVGQPCEITWEEHILPIIIDNADLVEDAEALEVYLNKTPYVGNCTAENNEMCGNIPPEFSAVPEDPEESTTPEDVKESTTEGSDEETEQNARKMEMPSRKLHHVYSNEAFPEDTSNDLDNYGRRKKDKKSKSKLRKSGHAQLSTENKLALNDDLEIEPHGKETRRRRRRREAEDEEKPQPGICNCGYRNEVRVGMKIFLEADDKGICRGPVGFPCKSLFLGQDKDGLRGHQESCVSGICDMDGDMCSPVEIISEEPTDAATTIHLPTPNYFILQFILWLAIAFRTSTTLV